MPEPERAAWTCVGDGDPDPWPPGYEWQRELGDNDG